MATCRFYKNTLQVSSKNTLEKMTRSEANGSNFNTSVKITYCLLSVLQQGWLFKRFQTAMHSGKINMLPSFLLR